MALYELKMPKLGESVTEGTIGKWLKQPGEKVAKYDLLVEVQTDKVNTEIPSPIEGTLKDVKVNEGETVPIGALLAVFETADGAVAAAGGASAATPEPATPAPSVAAPSRAPEPQTSAPAAQQTVAPAPSAAAAPNAPAPDIRATPAVRKLAAEHGLDLGQIEGTGLNGRVSRQDVERYIAAQAAAPAARPAAPATSAAARPAAAPPPVARPMAGDELMPFTQMRRAIADHMTKAWTAPHAHAVMEVDMTNLMRYRDEIKGEFQRREGFDLSPAAFIVQAAVEALRAVPLVNAKLTDKGILKLKAINVGYAVALGDEGLIVPVIKDADEKSLAGLMRAIRDLVDRAKARKLTLADLEGATFTLNNTGPLGTIVSSPIVPPGQVAIASSESIRKRLVVLEEDQLAIRWMMNLVIGFDHRVIDGSTAARFLAAMRDWLQSVGPHVPVY